MREQESAFVRPGGRVLRRLHRNPEQARGVGGKVGRRGRRQEQRVSLPLRAAAVMAAFTRRFHLDALHADGAARRAGKRALRNKAQVAQILQRIGRARQRPVFPGRQAQRQGLRPFAGAGPRDRRSPLHPVPAEDDEAPLALLRRNVRRRECGGGDIPQHDAGVFHHLEIVQPELPC